MTAPLRVQVQRLAKAKGLAFPAYQSDLAAGADLVAAVAANRPVTLKPGQRTLIPTGLKIAVPPGYEAQIRPRSGLAFRQGLTVLNTPGTVDADYRGEVQVLLANLGDADIVISRGERIAQMVIAAAPQADFVETKRLPPTARGAGGFGSTGTSTEAQAKGAGRKSAKRPRAAKKKAVSR